MPALPRRSLVLAGAVAVAFYVLNFSPWASLAPWSSHRSSATLARGLPETKLVSQSPGFTLLDDLYALNGVFYAVTSDPSSIPEAGTVATLPVEGRNVNIGKPADETFFKIISPQEAEELLGPNPSVLNGSTMFFWDATFLDHFYHLVLEMFLGAWRMLASTMQGSALGMEMPNKIIFARQENWREHWGLNDWFLQAAFPNIGIDEPVQWKSRVDSLIPIRFQRIVIADRGAAHRTGEEARRWNKSALDVIKIPAPVDWWQPLLSSVMSTIQINPPRTGGKPIITYIDRQKTGRRMTTESHEQLVAALEELEEAGLAVVQRPQMEFLTKAEQVEVSLRTNIMIGVHGNGLSNQLWMAAGGHVIEIMVPGGYTKDYMFPADVFGHTHYLVWNDTLCPRGNFDSKPGMKVPEGFHGSNIPLDGPFIKQLLLDVVKGKSR